MKPEATFEQWVSNRFGKRLYRTFFKTYTEKVWGIPCSEITAEWAAQRIKGLSLRTALATPSRRARTRDKGPVDQDLDRCVRLSAARARDDVGDASPTRSRNSGATCDCETDVARILWKPDRVEPWRFDGRRHAAKGSRAPISSAACRSGICCRCFEPAAPDEVLEAADRLELSGTS